MKNFLVLVLIILFAVPVMADLKKGSVGNGGIKRYAFIANQSGQAQVTLIFDNPTSDIDVAAGIFIDNEPVFLGIDVSNTKNFGRIEFGVGSGSNIWIVVNSYRGSSPFRLFVTSGTDEAVSNYKVVEVTETRHDFDKVERTFKAFTKRVKQ